MFETKPQISYFTAIDIKNTTIRISDGGGNSIDVRIGEGNLSWDETRNMDYIMDGGRLDDVREGDEEAMDVNLDATWEYVTGTGTAPTIIEALKGIGAASSWTSTDSNACRPYAVNITLVYEPKPDGCGDDESVVLPDFRWEQISYDLRDRSFSFSGKCNATQATAVRTP